MQLFHTSPSEIKEINDLGRFGEFLFFSNDEYVMTAGEHVVYSIEIDDEQIIEASQLFYHEDAEKLEALVSELAEELEIDEDDAEALIEESKSIYDIESNVEAEDMAEASWNIQLYTARAAKALGFRGVEVEDEQGSAYMIAMRGNENELVKQ
ncbi:hypothetical protein [Carnimonas bestiolae]|uniref:hypothetical protein n=1 Tax=Carnimonas bestiolae TaxID=3402172 RepID=UPI003EDC0C3C